MKNLFGNKRGSKKICGCLNCPVCQGKGRNWNSKISEWDYCQDCNGRGSIAFCFEDAKRLNMLDKDDIARHAYYTRRQVA